MKIADRLVGVACGVGLCTILLLGSIGILLGSIGTTTRTDEATAPPSVQAPIGASEDEKGNAEKDEKSNAGKKAQKAADKKADDNSSPRAKLLAILMAIFER